jgi:hypothetical protein
LTCPESLVLLLEREGGRPRAHIDVPGVPCLHVGKGEREGGSLGTRFDASRVLRLLVRGGWRERGMEGLRGRLRAHIDVPEVPRLHVVKGEREGGSLGTRFDVSRVLRLLIRGGQREREMEGWREAQGTY